MFYNRDELETGRLVWLLDITIRGRVYRFSTDVIEVMTGDTEHGNPSYHYAAGLEFLEYEDTLNVMESGSADRTVSVSVVFQGGQQAGWEAIADTTRDAGTATGELSLLIVGETHKNRRRLVRGYLDSPVYGNKNEPVEFTLTQADHLDMAMYPRPAMQVNVETFPNFNTNDIAKGFPSETTTFLRSHGADDAVMGEYYPVVFGQPGTHTPRGWVGWSAIYTFGHPKESLFASSFEAVPGLAVVTDLEKGHSGYDLVPTESGTPFGFMIAGHECSTVQESSHDLASVGSVLLYNQDWSVPLEAKVYQYADQSGQAYSMCWVWNKTPTSFEASTGFEYAKAYLEAGAEVWVSFTGVGGVPNKQRTGPLLGAGEIIQYLMEQSFLDVDTFKNLQPLKAVDHFVFDFWFNEPRSPWDIVNEDLLPYLPLSSYASEAGVAFVFWNWDATKQDAVEHINIDNELGERTGPVEVSPISEIYNNITINYCQTGSDSQFRKSMTYTHDSYGKGENFIQDAYSYASFTRYGERIGPVIDCPTIERDSTAAAILDWNIRYFSQSRRSVSYVLGQKFQSLDLGHVVTITDPDINFDEVVCLVTSVVRVPGQTEVTFTTTPNWAIDPKV